MADRFFGVAVGGKKAKDVTEASSTTSAAVELRISDSAYATLTKAERKNVLLALEEYLLHKEGTPIS